MEKSCKDKANELLLRQMERLEEEVVVEEWPRGQDGRWLALMLTMLANAIQYPQLDYSTLLTHTAFNGPKEETEAEA